MSRARDQATTNVVINRLFWVALAMALILTFLGLTVLFVNLEWFMHFDWNH